MQRDKKNKKKSYSYLTWMFSAWIFELNAPVDMERNSGCCNLRKGLLRRNPAARTAGGKSTMMEIELERHWPGHEPAFYASCWSFL